MTRESSRHLPHCCIYVNALLPKSCHVHGESVNAVILSLYLFTQHNNIYIYIILNPIHTLKQNILREKNKQKLPNSNPMAGIQFYFFPTDFYYPRPPKAIDSASNPPPNELAVLNQPQKDDVDHHEHVHVQVQPNKAKLLKLLSSSSPPASIIPKTSLHVDQITNPFA